VYFNNARKHLTQRFLWRTIQTPFLTAERWGFVFSDRMVNDP